MLFKDKIIHSIMYIKETVATVVAVLLSYTLYTTFWKENEEKQDKQGGENKQEGDLAQKEPAEKSETR